MPKIRIAVDARPLSHPGTGIARYTEEILKRVCAHKNFLLFLYSDQKIERAEWMPENLVCRELPNIRIPMMGSVFSQLVYPLWAKKDAIELFWSPRHHLPLLLGKQVIKLLTIHDLVWSVCGETMAPMGRWLESVLMPRSVAAADVVMSVSEHTALDLQRILLVDAKDIVVVPNASLMKAYTGPIIKGDYWLFVGTEEPRKNLERLLIAYKSYVNQVPSAKRLMLVLGAGWGDVDVLATCESLHLSGLVEIKDKLGTEELMHVYRNAFALLMPSLYEGFGLPIIEALSQGVPVITSNSSSMPEVCGPAGMLVDPLDTHSIAQALVDLDSNRELYLQLQKATVMQNQKYSWNKSGEIFSSVITATFQ